MQSADDAAADAAGVSSEAAVQASIHSSASAAAASTRTAWSAPRGGVGRRRVLHVGLLRRREHDRDRCKDPRGISGGKKEGSLSGRGGARALPVYSHPGAASQTTGNHMMLEYGAVNVVGDHSAVIDAFEARGHRQPQIVEAVSREGKAPRAHAPRRPACHCAAAPSAKRRTWHLP